MKEVLEVIFYITIAIVSCYLTFIILEFITNVPKQLKRIADALEDKHIILSI